MIVLLSTILIGVAFIYGLYCLIDLWLFKLKTIATMGSGTTKHINLYRLLFSLQGGKSAGRVPDILFRIGIALKIDAVITVILLVLTIIFIGMTATLGIFSNATAAVIRTNQSIIQERREESTTETSESTTDENTTTSTEEGNWVDDKDNDRHSNDSAETTEGTETTEPTEQTNTTEQAE